MKILFVCKRRPQQRDLISRPYGRFHYLPAGLAKLGHEVQVLLIGHHGDEARVQAQGGVEWVGLDARQLRFGLMAELHCRARKFAPDWVVGCSDSWCGWIAARLARRGGSRLAIDAYDNYEAYMPWNLPLHWAWRRSIGLADLVCAAGPQLAELLNCHRRGRSAARILPMAADPGFVPHDKRASRELLGLPEGVPLIGYNGGWASDRGTRMLKHAYRKVREANPLVQLVLTGKPPLDILEEPGVLALGYVDDRTLPMVVSSLDVACVITAENRFGKFSYPSKLCEAMACGTPVAATATGPVAWTLDNNSRFLCPPGDPDAFAALVLSLLGHERVNYGVLPDWETEAERLESWLGEVER